MNKAGEVANTAVLSQTSTTAASVATVPAEAQVILADPHRGPRDVSAQVDVDRQWIRSSTGETKPSQELTP